VDLLRAEHGVGKRHLCPHAATACENQVRCEREQGEREAVSGARAGAGGPGRPAGRLPAPPLAPLELRANRPSSDIPHPAARASSPAIVTSPYPGNRDARTPRP
jgi:hypothetical protein